MEPDNSGTPRDGAPMAVRCEFLSVIVPIARIDRVYPGGYLAYKEANARDFKRVLWDDGRLFRDGAMDPAVAEDIVRYWENLGLRPTEEVDGKKRWKELCVVASPIGPTLPCDWLVYDRRQSAVSLAGEPPGPVVGREYRLKAREA